jgi:threonine/homoserine/homoserine lactone efflux protein
MNTSNILEVAGCLFCLLIGTWATMYAYGLSGERLVGRYRWNPNIKRTLRWIGPLQIILSGVAIFLILKS